MNLRQVNLNARLISFSKVNSQTREKVLMYMVQGSVPEKVDFCI